MIGVTIGLERPTYSVDEEDGVIEVCAVLLAGSLERTVSVTFSTSDGSAIGMILIESTFMVLSIHL